MRVSRRVFGLCLILLMLFTTLAGATEGLSGNDVASTVEPLLEPDFWGFEWGSPIAEVDEILGKAADTTVQEGGIVRQIRLVRVFGKLALLQLRFSSEGTLYGGVMQPILSPEEVSDYQDELYNRLVEKYSNPAELELDEPEFGYGWGKNSTYINYLYSLEEGVDEHPDSLSTLLVYVDGNHPHDFIDFVEWFGGTPPEEAALTPEPLKDFFSDDARTEKFAELRKAYKFSDLQAMVDEYIETENPGDGDSAYQINETLSEIHALLQLCDFVVDDFDGTTKVYYKGVSEISESINFIPYFKTGDYDFRYDGEMYFRLGFVADDWLFFERIYFKYDDTIVDRKWRSDREVIGGGNILEIADNESDQFVKEREHPIFFTSDNITIRFEGDDGTHDHVLTEDELNALHTLYEIDQLVSELGNIRYAWEKQNPKDRE